MLIDINSYIGNWPYRDLKKNSLHEMVQRMNGFGVDKAVVSNLNGIFYVDCQIANEELHRAINTEEEFKDRFIPFATINPILPWWKRSMEACSKELGMKGIRIYPLYHEYKLTDGVCLEMVKMARDMNMPVSIPMRMVDLRERSWLDINIELTYNDIASIVEKVPDAKYMVLDARLTDFQERTTKRSIDILKNADILFDTVRCAGVPCKGPNGESMSYMIESFGPDKMAFGTETPFVDYCSPFICVAAYEEADEKTRQMIWSENARRMLGI